MSKLNSDKINFNENDVLVEISETDKNQISKHELLLNRAQSEAQDALKEAQRQASEIVERAKQEMQAQKQEEMDKAQKQASEIVERAKQEADNIIAQANITKDEILAKAQTEIEHASQEAANKGYEEGYKDAQGKFFEENEEKIISFDEFCSKQNVVRDKILKNASREILNIIQSISKVVLLKELDSVSLDKIIQKTITCFDSKENITVVLSEKYAKLLYELQKKEADIDLRFEDFKQYKNFNVIYNKELPDDTIIVENLKERFCASIEQQLDKIIREILDNTQNGNIETEEYDDTSGVE